MNSTGRRRLKIASVALAVAVSVIVIIAAFSLTIHKSDPIPKIPMRVNNSLVSKEFQWNMTQPYGGYISFPLRWVNTTSNFSALGNRSINSESNMTLSVEFTGWEDRLTGYDAVIMIVNGFIRQPFHPTNLTLEMSSLISSNNSSAESLSYFVLMGAIYETNVSKSLPYPTQHWPPETMDIFNLVNVSAANGSYYFFMVNVEAFANWLVLNYTFTNAFLFTATLQGPGMQPVTASVLISIVDMPHFN
ncbi:MAG: hypothetical protein M1442_02495 [Candidatus Thermoplasmatota archaeon]|jgi:hypothetical protein|nr:hypothetical protein [Candidatus Thermoplasmatota archaeon]